MLSLEVWEAQMVDAMRAGNTRFDLLAPLFLKHDDLTTRKRFLYYWHFVTANNGRISGSFL